MELEESLSFVGMKLVLVIIKVKYRIMTSCIQYKIQYKYNIQYTFRPNPHVLSVLVSSLPFSPIQKKREH